MEWKHKCSLSWLRERQGYLTASEIRSLVPLTKTGRPRKIDDMDRLKVLAGKKVMLTEEDCWSYGAMARGHLLEPYAIDALNDYLIMMGVPRQEFFHWDDELITVPGRLIAFSPDAMDIPQLHNYGATPYAIAEVKCYTPERHMVTAYTMKQEIEERWQIATAMATLDSIEYGYLVLFNPSMEHERLFVTRYSRAELQDEIDVINQVELDWDKFLHTKMALSFTHIGSSLGKSEADIIDELERAQRMNPV